MENRAADQFNFTREAFYAAKKALSPSGLGVWCYLADGYEYNKKAIAKLNNITERSVERGFVELQNKHYYINGVFFAFSQLVDVQEMSSNIIPIEEEKVKMDAVPSKQKWVGTF